jgi:acyl-CoA thioesterase I
LGCGSRLLSGHQAFTGRRRDINIWPVIRVVAFEFAGGDAFFIGLALLATAAIVAVRRDGPRVRIGCRLATICGAIVVATSATPLPLWFYGIGAILIALSLSRPPGPEPGKWRTRFRVVVSLLIGWCGLAAGWEFSYRLPIRYDGTRQYGKRQYDALAVIGDSVSAGLLGPHERTWPKQFREQHGGSIIDLSAEGATAKSALNQARALNSHSGNFHAVVVIEIGGNDYFESVPPADFAAGLETLLTALKRPDRQLVMLELPLPPFFNEYGRVQRELAGRYDIPLVSKREFARVVFTRGATLDTVHLSESGHGLFAEMIWQNVGELLRRA